MPPDKAKPPQTEPLISAVFSLVGEPPAYHVSLTDEETMGIGFITVQWALLEAAIASVTQHICTLAEIPLPRDASNFSFARRLRTLRQVAIECLADGHAKEVLLKQIPTIARLAGQRQRVTHHLWEYDPSNPETLWSKSLRDPQLRLEPFDTRKMFNVGARVGQVTYALLNPLKLDQTTTGYLREMLDAGERPSFVSREFLLAVRKRAQSTLDHPPESPQAPKPPQSSSKD